MRNFIFFIFVLNVSIETQSQNIDFFREDLRFRLIENYFEVKGDYYFRNNLSSPLIMKLKYPFPQDSLFGKIGSVRCLDLSDLSSAINLVKQGYMMFTISIPANESKAYRISYHQHLRNNRALYILTTTHRWGKPFEQASYELVVENLLIDSLSYIPDKVEIFNDSTKFYWKKENFMPDRNFEVFFQKKPVTE